jgi:signal transduction histidine kinase
MARLYITLYGLLFITGGLFVLGLVWLPEMVLKGTIQGYYDRSMVGVFGLVEDRLLVRPQQQWDEVIRELEPNFRSGLGLYELQDLPLRKLDQARLQRGEFVFTEKDQQTRFYKRVPNSDRYLMLALGPNIEQQEVDEVEGIVRLIEERFRERDQADWSQVITELGQKFKMPLALLPLDDPSLPADRLAEIEAGKLVVLGLKQHRETYYLRVLDSGLVFRAGPYETPLVLRHFNMVLLVVFALVIALAVYIWVRPIWRQLSRFDRGVNRLGCGDLTTRLEVSNGAALKPLAETFNAMAERIQHLILSHRELTGAVSHELRTPIARLRFRVDMLEEPLSGEDVKRHVKAMRRDIVELEELVSESLSYTRLDRERPDLVFEPVYLMDWLQALLIETEDDIQGVQTALSMQPEYRQLQVQLDSKLMGRAVKNLLRNGRRHASSRLTVIGGYQVGLARIVVEDDGVGVPQQERERIFEPFSRLDVARDRESGGVGLGLAIVRQIARWHEGKAWVESASNGGARFVIEWPATNV